MAAMGYDWEWGSIFRVFETGAIYRQPSIGTSWEWSTGSTASWDWVNRNLALKACSTGIEYRHRQHRVASLSTSSMDSRLPDHHLDQYLSLLADPLNPRLYNKKCVLLPFFGCWPRHVVKVIPVCGNLGAISSAVWRWGTSLLHMIGQHLAKEISRLWTTCLNPFWC